MITLQIEHRIFNASKQTRECEEKIITKRKTIKQRICYEKFFKNKNV